MRDGNILKSYKRGINLQTRKMKSKKAYNRKKKHKNQENEGFLCIKTVKV